MLARCFLIILLASFISTNMAGTFYVDVNSTNPTPPFTNWSTAAQTIQEAVDQTANGDTVIVADGVYRTGARRFPLPFSVLTNRVVVTNSILLESVNGATVTYIEGYHNIPGGNGTDAIRCVFMTNGGTLKGFTLTNGATLRTTFSAWNLDFCGGGVCCGSIAETVSDCVFVNDWCHDLGAGAQGGTLTNCVLRNNRSTVSGGAASKSILVNCSVLTNWALNTGGGVSSCFVTNTLFEGNFAAPNSPTTPFEIRGGAAFQSVLDGCVVSFNYTSNSVEAEGGAVYGSTVNRCLITSNYAQYWGGGASRSRLNNSLVIGNTAGYSGGGSYLSGLTNCTVVANSAPIGGGVDIGTNWNCIIYANSGGVTANYRPTNVIQFNYCCTTPDPESGIGNFTNDPILVAIESGDAHLGPLSPCINAGNNACAAASTDLELNARIIGDTIDVGAYEFQSPQSRISYQWLSQYRLPTDGSIDFQDSDADGMSNWQEWRAGTDPTNAASVLNVFGVFSNNASGITLTWPSVDARLYSVQRSADLSLPNFTVISSNIAGLNGFTSWTDTNAPNPTAAWYRISVQ